MTPSRPARATRLAYRALQLGLGLVFLGTVAHHVANLDFKPLAALGVPILLMYFSFGSLQYIRSKSVSGVLSQKRSLHAAERAVQATVWHLVGVVLGTSLHALLMHSGLALDPQSGSLERLWLLLFLAPYALMLIGLLSFMRALWIIAPDFLRPVGSVELARRVRA
jgi:hypothetical protein